MPDAVYKKLEDEDTGEIHYTDIVCQYLDQDQCRCTVYNERSIKVPTCVQVTAEGLKEWNWLPTTCAYRLLAEGKALEWWHPLVSGTQETVYEAGISVKHQCVSEAYVHEDEWQERVIRWVES